MKTKPITNTPRRVMFITENGRTSWFITDCHLPVFFDAPGSISAVETGRTISRLRNKEEK
jgi:hypothetical protein